MIGIGIGVVGLRGGTCSSTTVASASATATPTTAAAAAWRLGRVYVVSVLRGAGWGAEWLLPTGASHVNGLDPPFVLTHTKLDGFTEPQ